MGSPTTERARLCCVLALVPAAACAASDIASPCDDLEGDDVVITSALDDATDLEFIEQWRVAGGDDVAHLGFPLPLAVSADGRAAVADFMLSELFVIEADGTWRGTIARSGRGPGELASPVAAAWDEHGGLHVFDIMRPAIVRFDRDLVHTGDVPIAPAAVADILASGELGWAGITPAGSLLLITAPSRTEPSSESLLRYASGGVQPDTLLRASFPRYEVTAFAGSVPAPGWPRATAATTLRRSAAGTGDGYIVEVFDDDERAFRICAAVPPMPLRPDERGRTDDTAHAAIARDIAALEPPASPAAYGRIVVGADGSIWVERDRRSAFPGAADYLMGSAGAIVDVFHADGSYYRTVRLPPRSGLQAALGNSIWAYELNEFDDVALVRYAIR